MSFATFGMNQETKKYRNRVCLMFNILGTTRTVKLMPWMQHYYTIKEKQK